MTRWHTGDMADDGYDPRFDPAFQRGFEGDTAFPPRQAPSRPAPAAERIAPPPVVAPGEQQARVFADAQAQSRAQVRTAQDPYAEDAPPVRRRSDAEPIERFDTPQAPLRTNPFLIALLLIAIALIGGGLLIGSRLDAWYDDAPNGPGFFVLYSLQYGVPLAIAVGIATVIGVLFVFALRWRGRSDD